MNKHIFESHWTVSNHSVELHKLTLNEGNPLVYHSVDVSYSNAILKHSYRTCMFLCVRFPFNTGTSGQRLESAKSKPKWNAYMNTTLSTAFHLHLVGFLCVFMRWEKISEKVRFVFYTSFPVFVTLWSFVITMYQIIFLVSGQYVKLILCRELVIIMYCALYWVSHVTGTLAPDRKCLWNKSLVESSVLKHSSYTIHFTLLRRKINYLKYLKAVS
jgi:hypothetical protein